MNDTDGACGRLIAITHGCISPFYEAAGPLDGQLLMFVMNERPNLAAGLAACVDRLFGENSWSSPGNSQGRAIQRVVMGAAAGPGAAKLESRLTESEFSLVAETRERMREAFDSRRFSHWIYPDAAASFAQWQDNGFSVVVVVPSNLALRLREMVTAHGLDGGRLSLTESDAGTEEQIGTLLRSLSRGVQALLITGHYIWLSPARAAGYRTAQLDRRWASLLYREPGYGVSIGSLNQLDPQLEMAVSLA